jgi:hypothetical protein
MLLLWSIKESDLAQGNCTCCTVDEYIIASQKHWQLLSLSLSRSSQFKSVPSRPKCNSLWSVPSGLQCPPPRVHLLLGQRNPIPYLDIEPHLEDSAANSGFKTLQNPGTLKSWSISNRFLLFGRGIVSCCRDICWSKDR